MKATFIWLVQLFTYYLKDWILEIFYIMHCPRPMIVILFLILL